jgi:hypothetical protein
LEYLFRESPRCGRIIEIQKISAARLYGPRAAWKDVGQRLLDDNQRTGRHELAEKDL